MNSSCFDLNDYKETEDKLNLLKKDMQKLNVSALCSELENPKKENVNEKEILETYKDIGKKIFNVLRNNDDKLLANILKYQSMTVYTYSGVDVLLPIVNAYLRASEVLNIVHDFRDAYFSKDDNFGSIDRYEYLDKVVYFFEYCGDENGYIVSRLLKHGEMDDICSEYEKLLDGKISEKELNANLNSIFDKFNIVFTSFAKELPHINNIELLDSNMFWFYGYSGLVKLPDGTFNIDDDDDAFVFPHSSDVLTIAKKTCADMIKKEAQPPISASDLRERNYIEKRKDFDDLISLGVDLDIFNSTFTIENFYKIFNKNANNLERK